MDYSNHYQLLTFESVQVKYRQRKVLEVLNQYQPKHILEIGCGLSSMSEFYHTFDSFTIVEPYEQFIEAVSKKIDHDRVRINKGTLQDCVHSLTSQSFDFIILSGVLHENIDSNDLLIAINQLSNDTTISHINVPNQQSLHRILGLYMGVIDSLNEPSERQKLLNQPHCFSIDMLSKLVETHGFSIIEQGSYFLKPLTHDQMFQLTKQQVINDALLDAFYDLVELIPDSGSEIYVNVKKLD